MNELARLRELGTVEAKRAYLDEQIEFVGLLRRELEGEEYADSQAWLNEHVGDRIFHDIAHWENDVRAVLRRDFEGGTDRYFDSDDAGKPDIVSGESQAEVTGYLDRRSARMREVRRRLG